jgi:AdoMet dependent proline di-methyltransferase
VKENVTGDKFLIDRSDNSIMRTTKHFEALFEESGL